MVVCANDKILGVIYLKDTVKPGLTERFDRLRKIGIKKNDYVQGIILHRRIHCRRSSVLMAILNVNPKIK